MTTGSPVPPLARILVVDDNPIIQRAVYFALRDKNYQVLMAGDVAAAMKTIREHKVDLVFIDLSFPLDSDDIGGTQKDGFYLVDWIRRTGGGATTPLVIISSTNPEQYRQRAAAAGISACVQKPLDRESLLQLVQSALGHAQHPPGPAQP